MGDVLACLFWLSVGAVLYHGLGYPFLLFLATRLVGKPVQRASIFPAVSVIVPAHNEGGVIKEKLESVLRSSYPGQQIEIIVTEDGSTDNTAAQVLAVQDPRVILDHSDTRGGKMAAMNRAVRRATSDFFIFTDANANFTPDTLPNLMANFADPRVGCVTGKKVVRGDDDVDRSENAYWKYESWIKQMENRIGSPPAAVGELLAIRRAVFQIPDKRIINDDFYLIANTVRQGYRAAYDASAVTVEKGSASVAVEYDRKSRIAAGRWQQVWQILRLAARQPGFVFMFVSHKLLRLLVFPLMMLALVSDLGALLLNWSRPGTLLSLGAPWVQLLFLAQVIFYLLAILGSLLNRLGIRVKPLYLLYYLVSSQAAMLGGLVRFSSRGQTVLWKKAAR